VAANGYDFATSTLNISCLGAYCHITKYIPPFTRVAIKLSLPIVAGNRKKNYDLSCEGVLVRTEDDSDGGFNIAIFFNRIRQPQRRVISRYIKQFLPGRSLALRAQSAN
jgi:hypothetical protein